MAEEFCRGNSSRAEVENQARAEMEKTLGTLKHDYGELMDKFKESENRCQICRGWFEECRDPGGGPAQRAVYDPD